MDSRPLGVSLSKPGQTFDYFEIDPLAVRMARGYFTFLDEAAGQIDIRLGDGRLALAGVPDQSYDLLILDAFTSDASPVHLLTAEAIDLYRRKVKPSGLVLLHLSNQHLDLRRVAAGWGRAARRLPPCRRYPAAVEYPRDPVRADSSVG